MVNGFIESNIFGWDQSLGMEVRTTMWNLAPNSPEGIDDNIERTECVSCLSDKQRHNGAVVSENIRLLINGLYKK